MASITPSLSYSPTHDGAELAVDERPVARVAHTAHRVRTSLAMLGGERFIDVSAQPRTVPTLLRREAARRREDPNRWCNGVADAIHGDAVDRGMTGIPDTDKHDLEALLASVTYPLGRMARAHGAGPLPFVPRWAQPALRAATPTDAVRRLFGRGASRAMARALPRGLIPGDTAPAEAAPDLRPLGLAWSLRHHVDNDRLAIILAGRATWRPSQHWPTNDELHSLERLWEITDAPTAVSLALDELSEGAGIARLTRALQLIEPVALVSAMAVARNITRLEEQAATIVPPAPPPPRPRRRAPARPDPLPAVPRNPPRTPLPDRLGDVYDYPPAIEIVHGYRLGDHRFVLPRNRADLTLWGRRLANCLADYADAVAAGRSVVIGLEERGTLVAALELTRDDTVRQLVGPRNARPTGARRAACHRMLRDLGLGLATA